MANRIEYISDRNMEGYGQYPSSVNNSARSNTCIITSELQNKNYPFPYTQLSLETKSQQLMLNLTKYTFIMLIDCEQRITI